MADEQKTEETKTVTVEDLNGTEFEVPVGLDGENPVSPNNPPLKAVAEADRDQAVKAREVELEFASALADVSGAGEGAASTNKEDNNPGTQVVDAGKEPQRTPESRATHKNK